MEPLQINEKTAPELPQGWVWTTLGEICFNPQYGWTTSAKNDGNVHLLRTTDITSGDINWDTVPFCDKEPADKDKYLLREGDIVISRAGSVGYSYLIKNTKEAVFASYLIRFKPLIDEQYVSYFLKSPSYWDSISEKSLGIAIPNVNATKLKQILIPFPPLPEQHRIVTKIEELFTQLDAGVASLKKTQAQLKQYRQSVLKSACEGKLVPTEAELARAEGREYELAEVLLEGILNKRRIKWWEENKNKKKYVELFEPRIGNSINLSDGWVLASIDQICFLDVGFAFKSSEFCTEGIRLLRGDNIEPGSLRWTNVRYWPKEKLASYENLLVRERDIILAMDRPLISSGLKIAKAKATDLPCLLVQRMARFRFIEPEMTEFIYYSFNVQTFINHLLAGQTGTQLPHISSKGISTYLIPIPPLAEQHRIVAEVERRLSVADQIETTIDQSLKQAERLRQSILKKAFEGKLVLQNSDDEPANVLLERIKEKKVKREIEEKNNKKIKSKKKKVNQMENDGVDLKNTIKLHEILKSSERSLTPKELWQSSKLEIDDFYAELKTGVERGRIIERRPDDTAVFLEVGE